MTPPTDGGPPRWGVVVSFPRDTDNPLWWMWTAVEAYLDNQQPFQRGYTRDDLDQDLLEYANGDPELVQDFLELVNLPEDRTPAGRIAHRRKKDPWAGIRKLSARERGNLCNWRTPFVIKGVRRWKSIRQRKQWERELDTTWQLLIEDTADTPGLLGRCIFTLGPNPMRNRVLDLLRNYLDNPEERSFGPCILYWKKLANGRDFMMLARREE